MNLGILEEIFPPSELDAKGFEKCMCNELGEKLKKSESKWSELEFEIQKTKRDNQILDAKLTAFEEEKSVIEDELKVLKMENRSKPSYGGEEPEEEDEILQLKIENKTLECEKQMVEKEVEIWKRKYKELESRVSKKNQILGKEEQEETATPYNDTPDKQFCSVTEEKSGEDHLDDERNRAKRVTRKMLFREDVEPIVDASNLVDIEMRCLNDQGDINCGFSNEFVMEGTVVGNKKAMEIGNLGDDEDVDDCEKYVEVVCSTLKRKKACNVVTSDIDSDVEDNIPISQRFGIRPLAATPNQTSSKLENCSLVSSPDRIDDIRDTVTCTRRRLVKLRQNEERVRKKKSRKMMSEDVQDDDSVEGSDDERDSLDDFIVTDSDDSLNELEDDVDCDDENVVDAVRDYHDDSDSEDGSPDYPEWEYEADMLAALGKDPNLCMKGVCAIYRRQISEEPDHGIPFYPDGRGFNLFDAPRGSKLAYFLTEGDPDGDVKKSVEELIEFDPEGEDICYKLAARYSRQLFEIYKNKEDPYFPHS